MSDKASTGEKDEKTAPSNDDTSGKESETQNVPSTSKMVHRDAGYEKFATIGGSGGAPTQNKQGYEGLAEH